MWFLALLFSWLLYSVWPVKHLLLIYMMECILINRVAERSSPLIFPRSLVYTAGKGWWTTKWRLWVLAWVTGTCKSEQVARKLWLVSHDKLAAPPSGWDNRLWWGADLLSKANLITCLAFLTILSCSVRNCHIRLQKGWFHTGRKPLPHFPYSF